MPVKKDYKQQLEEVQEVVDAQRVVLRSGKEKDDDTRQEVAKKFLRYYFEILILLIVVIPFYNLAAVRLTGSNELVISFKDAVLTYSAVVGPTMGLVMAYYFESKKDD